MDYLVRRLRAILEVPRVNSCECWLVPRSCVFETKRFTEMSERYPIKPAAPSFSVFITRSFLKYRLLDLRSYLGRLCARWATEFFDDGWLTVGPVAPPCERHVPKTSNSVVFGFSPGERGERLDAKHGLFYHWICRTILGTRYGGYVYTALETGLVTLVICIYINNVKTI